MPDPENEKHRHSIRLKTYNYAWRGSYFVTICTHQKQCVLGSIRNGQMTLSRLGHIVEDFWQEIPEHFHNVQLHAFVVMPNHIHGILKLICQRNAELEENRFQHPGKNTVSSIVGAYKASVTRHAHRLGLDFEWQRNYYEHIIRDHESWLYITNYINSNPQNWEKDKLWIPPEDPLR